jgi:hypothetical protein
MSGEAASITGAGMVAQSAGSVNQIPDQQQDPSQDNEQDKMFDFSTARIHLQRLVEDWQVEIEDTDVRRKTRDVEVDVEGLRQKGELDEDETLVPIRVIDTNIQREQPPFINYLKNSRRLCTFRSLSIPSQDPQNIEIEYTRGMTYTGWENAIFKALDGAMTHGWAAVEVVLDSSKPLNVSLEYIAHDKLFWPRSVESIKDAPRAVRMYKTTISRLKEWVRDFGFNPTVVEELAAKRRDTQKEGETLDFYKLFFKKEGVVYVGWFCLTDGATDWLKKPEKLFLGVREKQQSQPPSNITQFPGAGNAAELNMPPQQNQLGTNPSQGQSGQPQEQWVDSEIKEYPVFVLPYKETEKPKVVDHKGRCFYDEPKQEAQTAVLSGFINALTRASNTIASPSQEDGTGAQLKEIEDVKLLNGRIYNKPLNFWSHPYPDFQILQFLKYSEDANSEETNQVNFSAMNREDSRKTAKEIGAAQQQQSLLNSVQLTLFSTFIRETYSFAWLIVQSQAMQELIAFLQIQVPDQKAMQSMMKGVQDAYSQQMNQFLLNGQMVHPQVQLAMQNQAVQQVQQIQQQPPMMWQNDFKTIQQKWELRAAGDVDVIQRQEKINQMKTDWPVVSQTALAMRFLSDLIKLEYPDVGEQYAQILGETDMMNQARQEAAALGSIIIAIMKEHPEIMKTISPQELQQLNQLLSHVMGQSGKTPQDVDDKITGKSNTKNEQRKQSIQSDNGQTSPS